MYKSILAITAALLISGCATIADGLNIKQTDITIYTEPENKILSNSNETYAFLPQGRFVVLNKNGKSTSGSWKGEIFTRRVKTNTKLDPKYKKANKIKDDYIEYDEPIRLLCLAQGEKSMKTSDFICKEFTGEQASYTSETYKCTDSSTKMSCGNNPVSKENYTLRDMTPDEIKRYNEKLSILDSKLTDSIRTLALTSSLELDNNLKDLEIPSNAKKELAERYIDIKLKAKGKKLDPKTGEVFNSGITQGYSDFQFELTPTLDKKLVSNRDLHIIVNVVLLLEHEAKQFIYYTKHEKQESKVIQLYIPAGKAKGATEKTVFEKVVTSAHTSVLGLDAASGKLVKSKVKIEVIAVNGVEL